MAVKFGPAGNSDSFSAVHKSSLAAPRWIRDFGLDAYEYQCGKGINVGEETARKLGENAYACGISMSLHAPYFINLANPDPSSLEKTAGYIVASCRVADWMGAGRITVHTGSVMKRTRREAQEVALASVKEVVKTVDGEGYGHISLCLETMGKINQLGDLDEVLELCQLDERLLPCVDFGHLYARTLGEMDGSREQVHRILDRMGELLGEERASRFHSHFSRIQFTPGGGEKMHLTFAQSDYGPDHVPLMQELAERGWSPTIICESAGTQAEDALEMKSVYQAYRIDE